MSDKMRALVLCVLILTWGAVMIVGMLSGAMN